jgi:hypothetical protein
MQHIGEFFRTIDVGGLKVHHHSGGIHIDAKI